MIFNPLYLLPFLALLFAIRGRWIIYNIDTYRLKVIWYCWRTKQSQELCNEMLELWPANYMALELWRWNFARYIVHQDHLIRMEEFVENELRRNDLTMKVFDEQKPPQDPSQN